MNRGFDLPIEPQTILNIHNSYALFLKDGYLNDENSKLGSWLLEYNTHLIDQEYRKLGYHGEKLSCRGHYYPQYGAVYWIIDTEIYSDQDGRELTDKYVKEQLKNI